MFRHGADKLQRCHQKVYMPAPHRWYEPLKVSQVYSLLSNWEQWTNDKSTDWKVWKCDNFCKINEKAHSREFSNGCVRAGQVGAREDKNCEWKLKSCSARVLTVQQWLMKIYEILNWLTGPSLDENQYSLLTTFSQPNFKGALENIENMFLSECENGECVWKFVKSIPAAESRRIKQD